MLFGKLVQTALLSCAAVHKVSALAISGDVRNMIKPYKRGEPLQDIVTWDEVRSRHLSKMSNRIRAGEQANINE
jgi:hypothetical protein